MKNSDFTNANLSECTLKYLNIEKCNFTNANFFNTKLTNIDFSDSLISKIILSDNFSNLKGVKVNEMQALELSKLLGIVITE